MPTTMIGVLTNPPTTPPLNAPSNGCLPKAEEGRPFLPTALLIFHRETLLFFQSFAPQSFPPQPPADWFISSFSLGLSVSTPLRCCSGHGATLGADSLIASFLLVMVPTNAPRSRALAWELDQLYGHTFRKMQRSWEPWL